jgi:hypothetical protein
MRMSSRSKNNPHPRKNGISNSGNINQNGTAFD